MAGPIIKARIFEGERWISVADHITDVQRYKDNISAKATEIERQSKLIIGLQTLLLDKRKSPDLGDAMGDIFDSFFGGKKK